MQRHRVPADEVRSEAPTRKGIARPPRRDILPGSPTQVREIPRDLVQSHTPRRRSHAPPPRPARTFTARAACLSHSRHSGPSPVTFLTVQAVAKPALKEYATGTSRVNLSKRNTAHPNGRLVLDKPATSPSSIVTDVGNPLASPIFRRASGDRKKSQALRSAGIPAPEARLQLTERSATSNDRCRSCPLPAPSSSLVPPAAAFASRDTTIQIQEDDTSATSRWVVDITHEYTEYVSLGTRGGGQSIKCIFKWPHDLVQLLGKGIHREPQMVAIGPYHHCRKHLQPMEDHKKKPLFRLLSLSLGLEVSNFVEALKQRELLLRDHYDELDTTNWPSVSFIKVMLLDDCFLLDILYELDTLVEPPLDQSIRKQLLNTYGHAVLIRDILYLLENKIPRLVLDVLIDVGLGECFLDPSERPMFSEALHLLELGRRSLFGPKAFTDSKPCNSPSNIPHIMDLAIVILLKKEKFVRSARKLSAAGVIFKKIEDSTDLFVLSFSWGILSLPELVMDETSEGMFTNIVAFVRIYPRAGTGVTSFLSFMDTLLDIAEDVSFLGNEGILKNNLRSDEATAKIFNKFGIHGMCDPFDKVQQQVQEYASSNLNECLAHFRQTYFTSLWTILSLIGTLLLILLTILHTAYTVVPYYRQNGA
ncbi:UPF0481 protein [Nymphaea thermarum]|nr:UPF0481 protein [Nymphaea thermarum]